MPPNLHGNGYIYLTKAKTGKFIEIFGSHANSCSTFANVQVLNGKQVHTVNGTTK